MMQRNIREHGAATRLTADVLVVGEGLAAVAAALTARAAGRQVLLAAPGTVVAAEITAGLDGQLAGVSTPTLRALVDAVTASGGGLEQWLDPAVTEIALDGLLEARGVALLLYAVPIMLVPGEGGEAAGVLMGGKDGCYVIAAGAVVDATADGALFRQSGVPFRMPASITARRTVVFEFAGPGAVAEWSGEADGFTLAARRTWPDQLCLTMTGSAPADGAAVPVALERHARLALPAVAQQAIAHLPPLVDAAVAVTGHQLIPLTGPRLATVELRHPAYRNVIAAGPWVRGAGWGDWDVLCACGETSGALVATVAGAPTPVTVALPTPEVRETDVLVVGGGTGGAVAALAAARHGVGTTVLESGHALGGIGTGGGIHVYYHGVCGGLQDHIDARTGELARALGNPARVSGFSPEAKKVALEQLTREAGADVHVRTTVAEVVMDGSRVTGVLAVQPGRLLHYRAKVVVDASGDADVAARAGAAFTIGRQSDGLPNVYSLVPGTRHNDRYVGLNFDAGQVDVTDILELTRARRHGLRHFLRPAPFTPEDRYTDISPLLGLRQSRQITCNYVLTLDDQVMSRHFPDTVAYGCCHHDNHKLDFQQESDEALCWVWVLGFWDRWIRHEVPYRSLLPVGIDGLLVGCRAVGISADAAMLFRMQRDMQRIGEAAGTAAALAAQRGIPPRQLEISVLQQALRATGALRDGQPILDEAEEQDNSVCGWVNHLYDHDPPVEGIPPLEMLRTRLEQPWGSLLCWQLWHTGADAVPVLQAVLRDGGPHARWWAAATLALLGREDGADRLLEAVRTREALTPIPPACPEWHNGWRMHCAPRWLSAVALLGKARCRAAVAPLSALLAEPGLTPIEYGTAIRALAEIGDPAAAPALHAFLQRSDLPEVEEHQHAARWLPCPVRHEVSWQLRLAVARALVAVGAPDLALIEPYLTHPQAHVRRYAHRVYAEATATAPVG